MDLDAVLNKSSQLHRCRDTFCSVVLRFGLTGCVYLSVQLNREDLGVELPPGNLGALVEVAHTQGARVFPRHDGHEAAGEQPLRDVDLTASYKIQYFLYFIISLRWKFHQLITASMNGFEFIVELIQRESLGGADRKRSET